MDKSEFLNLLSKRANISYDEARLFYDKFIARFAKAIKSGQNIRISGFGEFKRKIRKGKRVFDPKTGLERVIPSKVVVSFLPAKIFADKINIRYRNLKSVVVKVQPPVVEEKETDEFKLTFFEAEKKANGIKSGIVFGEYEPIVEPIQTLKMQSEDYLTLPEKPISEGKVETIDIEVPIFDVFQRVDVAEVDWDKDIGELEKVKINFEEVAMPEFNLTEESKQPQEKGEVKKI
ncbi:HU family DNA-binding protein, partial [Candidatus Kryptonium thompsonii]